MTTIGETRARRRVDQRVAQLEKELLLKREQVDRYYRRCCLLEQLVRAQALLLNGVRKRDHKVMGLAMEQILSTRRQLNERYEP